MALVYKPSSCHLYITLIRDIWESIFLAPPNHWLSYWLSHIRMWLIDISNIQISGVFIVSISPPRPCFCTNNIPAWALLPHSPIVLTCCLLNSFCLTRSRAQHERHVGIYMLWKGYPVSSPMHVYVFEPLLSVSMTVNLQLCDCHHRTCRPAPAKLILPQSLRCLVLVISMLH